jgi:hypothetical protein
VLVVGCYGLWCFGSPMGISLFGEATCYILFCLGASIGIGRMYSFL